MLHAASNSQSHRLTNSHSWLAYTLTSILCICQLKHRSLSRIEVCSTYRMESIPERMMCIEAQLSLPLSHILNILYENIGTVNPICCSSQNQERIWRTPLCFDHTDCIYSVCRSRSLELADIDSGTVCISHLYILTGMYPLCISHSAVAGQGGRIHIWDFCYPLSRFLDIFV